MQREIHVLQEQNVHVHLFLDDFTDEINPLLLLLVSVEQTPAADRQAVAVSKGVVIIFLVGILPYSVPVVQYVFYDLIHDILHVHLRDVFFFFLFGFRLLVLKFYLVVLLNVVSFFV